MRQLYLFIVLAFFSCQKDTDEYYVKYSIDSYHYQTGHKLELILNDENEERLDLIVDVREKVETIIGPVQSGFNASMLARDDGGNHLYELNAEISVSKNGGPFSLKAIDRSEDDRSFVLLEYVIDF